MKTCNLLADVK